MGIVIVKNGTPSGNRHLCKSCSRSQYTVGYRESDLILICCNVRPNLQIPFAVHKCSDYDDKFAPSYEQMEKLAMDLRPRASKKTRGFDLSIVSKPVRQEFDGTTESDDEGEDVDAVAYASVGDFSGDD